MRIQGISFPSDLDNDDGILDPVPPCFKSHLKCIKVIDYTAHEESLLAMKILLKKAAALDTMVISWCPEGDLVKQKLFEPLLELFPKGSNNCEIVFE
ncbi:hypothetical protein CJ030_MR2G004003 [Morella rubra]|uniref:FBD domain-containing protein n=1 Tax=Morella rubra TaxID=262757 RepID=A0A6A1WD45_9ROSI|nr:hypothetical protein CJ030_MR2G004003 [Morella rubra]